MSDQQEWLWSLKTGMSSEDVGLRWQAFLRRFDLERTFRMIKQTLGWTRPKLRTPEAAGSAPGPGAGSASGSVPGSDAPNPVTLQLPGNLSVLGDH